MASNDSFQETCERKSKDGRQIELIRILWMVCDAVEVRGGFDATIIDYSLPRNIRRLPLFRYTITTRVAMEPAIVNQRVTRAIKEHMGDIDIAYHKLQGNSTETHIFLIVSPTGLNYSLEKFLSSNDEAKDALSIVYNASKDTSASWKKLTPTAWVNIRFQVGAYILCSASYQDLAENKNWKQLEKSLERSLSESVESDSQDGFFMESYDPFAEADPFRFDNGENRSL
ncbi:hypothetical protein PSENEW3_00003577 [Picochlorum sp. SENEW3]|nr:hypothetical protein PSENEW3_00003577 [Picochlorum sp. SENEW3]